MEFYNVKSRKKVVIDDKEIKKQKVSSNGSVRYAVTALDNGTKLFKFVSEATWKGLNVPEV